MSKVDRKGVVPHRIVRLDIPIQQSYDDFRRRFESAVPMWNRERAVELVERSAMVRGGGRGEDRGAI